MQHARADGGWGGPPMRLPRQSPMHMSDPLHRRFQHPCSVHDVPWECGRNVCSDTCSLPGQTGAGGGLQCASPARAPCTCPTPCTGDSSVHAVSTMSPGSVGGMSAPTLAACPGRRGAGEGLNVTVLVVEHFDFSMFGLDGEHISISPAWSQVGITRLYHWD